MAAPLAVFRTDATPDIGAGHVSRCLALADGLARRGWSCYFAGVEQTPLVAPEITGSRHGFVPVKGEIGDEAGVLAQKWPDGIDFLITDHYARDERFEAACRPWASHIMVIDDLANRHHDCDLLVDQMPGRHADDYAGLTPSHCTCLLGPAYTLLRSEFRVARTKALKTVTDASASCCLVIGFGATDSHNVTARALSGISGLANVAAIDVVMGAASPHLDTVRDLMATLDGRAELHVGIAPAEMAAITARANIPIGALGVSTWERCCLGVPSVILAVGDNQVAAAQALNDAGAAVFLGRHENVSPDDIAAAVNALITDPAHRTAIAAAAAEICDGNGVGRVIDAVEASLHHR